jgi:hypothetical protein
MASAGGADRSPPPRRLVFAFYLTGHGFGHATRAIEVSPARHAHSGHDTAAPSFRRSSVKSQSDFDSYGSADRRWCDT